MPQDKLNKIFGTTNKPKKKENETPRFIPIVSPLGTTVLDTGTPERVVDAVSEPFKNFAKGVDKLDENPISGALDIGNSLLQMVATPFTAIDQAMRSTSQGGAVADVVAYPFEKVAEGIQEAPDAITKFVEDVKLGDYLRVTYPDLAVRDPKKKEKLQEVAQSVKDVTSTLGQFAVGGAMAKAGGKLKSKKPVESVTEKPTVEKPKVEEAIDLDLSIDKYLKDKQTPKSEANIEIRSKSTLTDAETKLVERNRGKVEEIFALRDIRLDPKPNRSGKINALKEIREKVKDIPNAKYDQTANKLKINGKEIYPIDQQPIGKVTGQKFDEAFYEKNRQQIKENDKVINKLREGRKNTGERVVDVVRNTLEPISSTLEKISPELKRGLRRFEFRSGINKERRLKKTEPFLEKQKEMNRADLIDFDLARKNGDTSKIEAILEKYDMRNEMTEVRKVVDDLADQAGVERRLREYHPRMVKDHKGFVEFIDQVRKNDSEVNSVFDNLIKEREQKVGKLSVEEKAKLINNALRGYNPGISLTKASFMKDRVLPTIEAKLNQFYHDSNTSLIKYIEQMTEHIEAKRFFGKGEDIYESIGNTVLDMVNDKKLTYAEANKVTDILKSRFNFMYPDKTISGIKNFSYAITLGQVKSAVRQLGDMSIALYRNGIKETVKEASKSLVNKSEIPLRELGIEAGKIAQEFSDPRRRAKALNSIFDVTGFTKVDRLGKETLVNSTLNRYKKLANKPTKEFNRRLEKVFGEDTQSVINDLRKGNVTENVKLLLFNELLDTQPIALSEMPLTYLKARNGRVFYMLKTFFIRRFDFLRNESFELIKNKKTRKEGMKNMYKLLVTLNLMEGGVDTLIDYGLGKKIDVEDKVVDNFLRLFLFSKYDINRAERDGIGAALKEKVLGFPTRLVDDLGKDFQNMSGVLFNRDNPKVLKTPRNIPLIGDFYWMWFGNGSKGKQTKFDNPAITKPSFNKPKFK